MDFLAKCPVNISFKSHSKTKYKKDKFLKGYAYLGLRGDNRIDFAISMSDNKRSYLIKISKWHLLRMLLFNLKLRPIFPRYAVTEDGKYEDQLWLNERMKKLKIYPNIDTMDLAELDEDIDQAVMHMKNIIKHSNGKDKETAEKQLNKLFDRIEKIRLLSEIEKCQKYELKSDILL